MDNNKILAERIARTVRDNGGRAYYVGGYVRDKLIGDKNLHLDLDIEVHGIPKDKLELLLNDIGDTIKVGKSFGIFKMAGYDIDVALPRREVSTGINHTDFNIIVDENIGTYGAAIRRDFTMNSVMEDILTGELIDHFGGVADIKNKVVRHVDDRTFSEDPLRVLRGAGFASRFDFTIDNSTRELCKKIDITKLSKERIFEELVKVFTKSNKPSKFFDELSSMNQLSYWFYEIEQLKSVEQNPTYHSEGNVYNHTMMVLDEGAKLRAKVKQPLNFMFSLLCHDLGKIVTTKVVGGKITSIRHEIEGIDLAKNLLKRFTNNKKLIQYVSNMVKLHMRPNICANDDSKVKVTNKMFYSSVEAVDLIYVAIADNRGRISTKHTVSPEEFLFKRLKIYEDIMSMPYVRGFDLIENGVKESENFSKIMEYATKLRLAGVEKKEALKQTISYAKQFDESKK